MRSQPWLAATARLRAVARDVDRPASLGVPSLDAGHGCGCELAIGGFAIARPEVILATTVPCALLIILQEPVHTQQFPRGFRRWRSRSGDVSRPYPYPAAKRSI
jgi:hypothetical protein